jgi:AcrR family transcriptional regulator
MYSQKVWYENMSTTPPPRNSRGKEFSSERLIAAGRKLFLARELGDVSVDLIAREAGLSRAAFYLHFNGRDDLLAAMMTSESYRLYPTYGWFKDNSPSPATIELFVRRRATADVVARIGKSFHLAALQSVTARKALQDNRARLMGVLGEHFPAFKTPTDNSDAEQRRGAEAELAMIVLEQLSACERESQAPAMFEQMVLTAVDQWIALHAKYPA